MLGSRSRLSLAVPGEHGALSTRDMGSCSFADRCFESSMSLGPDCNKNGEITGPGETMDYRSFSTISSHRLSPVSVEPRAYSVDMLESSVWLVSDP